MLISFPDDTKFIKIRNNNKNISTDLNTGPNFSRTSLNRDTP